MIGNPLLLTGGDYEISRSVRLRSSASAYFNRTPGSAGNRQTWTWSGWVKAGAISVARALFSSGADGSNYTSIDWRADDRIQLYSNSAGIVVGSIVWDPMRFRDPSAWYHIVVTCDTTNATQTDRFRFYVNGVRFTTISGTGGENTWPSQNANTNINNTVAHSVGRKQHGANEYFDGYLAEINFIDGQALTPASFGVTNAYGVWSPIKYNGTYGTNGFYLNFSDNSAATAAAIGKDYSGNGNNWTPNNISVTAGVTYDSMLDVPTLWADGGNGRGNYPVWNPLTSGGLVTFTEANLKALSTSASVPYSIESTIKTATTGKWYAEVTMAVGASNPAVGIGNNPSASSSNTDQWAAYRVNGTYITSGMGASSTGTPATFTTNDVIGIAYDVGAGTLSFYKNGTLQTGGFTGITAGNYSFIVRKDSASGDGGYLNCGQRPFAYTPPSGFKALNTLNLPEPTIKKGNQYFDVSTWTGNGSARSITNNGSMQPDLVWVKSRTQAIAHRLIDAVRGAGNTLASNLTNAEFSDPQGVTSFNSNGFGLGTDTSYNQSSDTYVGWQWKEGATQGFDIVTYSGSGGTQNVAHSLGVAPRMMIVKSRNTAGTAWPVYHASLGNTQVVTLNTTSATATVGIWGNTTPTSSVFTVSDAGATNGDTNFSGRTYVAYLFAEVAGFSKFGSYTGNGSSDGPFVFTGFRPRFIMTKRTDTAGNPWCIQDTSRNPTNEMGINLYANSSQAEINESPLDFLSNGMKIRNSGGNWNANGGTYIYAAFAESPFKLSLAR